MITHRVLLSYMLFLYTVSIHIFHTVRNISMKIYEHYLFFTLNIIKRNFVIPIKDFLTVMDSFVSLFLSESMTEIIFHTLICFMLKVKFYVLIISFIENFIDNLLKLKSSIIDEYTLLSFLYKYIWKTIPKMPEAYLSFHYLKII